MTGDNDACARRDLVQFLACIPQGSSYQRTGCHTGWFNCQDLTSPIFTVIFSLIQITGAITLTRFHCHYRSRSPLAQNGLECFTQLLLQFARISDQEIIIRHIAFFGVPLAIIGQTSVITGLNDVLEPTPFSGIPQWIVLDVLCGSGGARLENSGDFQGQWT